LFSTQISCLTTGLLCVLQFNVARAAEPTADSILAKVDVATNRARDASMTLSVQVQRKDDPSISRTMRVWQKGSEQRMVKFLEPARLRGTGILVPKNGTTYLYLPAYQRIRRVVGRDGGGSWMGTGFSIADLSRVSFATDYRPSLLSQTTDFWTLKLTPFEPEKHRHTALIIDVRRSDHLVANIRTLDTNNALLREISATDFRKVDGYMIAHQIQVWEATAKRRTLAKITRIRFDQGLGTEIFTQRELKRVPRISSPE